MPPRLYLKAILRGERITLQAETKNKIKKVSLPQAYAHGRLTFRVIIRAIKSRVSVAKAKKAAVRFTASEQKGAEASAKAT